MSDHKLAEALRQIANAKFGMTTADAFHLQSIAREALAAHEKQQAAQQQEGEAVAWHVVDADGQLMHAVGWKEAAHEHINDALNECGIAEAAKWRVIPVFTHPQQPLSDEQIDAAFAEHDKQFPFFSSRWSFEAGIEFAHGITKETKT